MRRQVNANIQGKLKGLVHVARISTQMGCVTTVCLVKKTDMPKVCGILTDWAKPIIAAQQMKAQAGLVWRTKLEQQGIGKAAAMAASFGDK